MIFIAHRGNLDGPSELENSPSQIEQALKSGFDVEIDVWYFESEQDIAGSIGYFLGHDCPEYKIDESFLKQEGLWCHAKNISALEKMLSSGIHCFWHQEDDYTITSQGHIWAYPGVELKKKCIAVMPETKKFKNIFKCSGICTDYPDKYLKKFLESKEVK